MCTAVTLITIYTFDALRSGSTSSFLLLIEYMVVGFCHQIHPLVYLAALLNVLHEKHPEPRVIDESVFCLVMTSLLSLTWISLLTMWNMWLTKCRDLQGLVDPLHCSSMDIFCAMVYPVHLHNAVVTLAHHLANEIVHCVYMCFDG